METRNRNVWIIVGVVVVALACMCACLAALAAGVWTWWPETRPFEFRGWDGFEGVGSQSARIEEVFQVGSRPVLEIESFAGDVSVVAGEDGTLTVVATKRALSSRDLDRIELEIEERSGSVSVRARHQAANLNNAWVEIEVTAPAGTRLDVQTGAGTVNLRGLTCDLAVDTGAGTIDIRDGGGPVAVHTGAGTIRYEGRPTGTCDFATGAGSIDLRLPADQDMEVDFHTGMGRVRTDFDVRGTVSDRQVRGTVGTGEGARIVAGTGLGSVDVLRR